MKRTLLCLAVVTLLVSCQTEQKEPESTEYETAQADSTSILDNFKAQEVCWNNQDIDCYMKAYSSTTAIQTISKGGVTTGYDAILGNYKKYFPKERMGKLHFDQMKIKRLSPEYYYTVGRFNLKYEERDTTFQGWFSVLLQKQNGEWLMISDHSS